MLNMHRIRFTALSQYRGMAFLITGKKKANSILFAILYCISWGAENNRLPFGHFSLLQTTDILMANRTNSTCQSRTNACIVAELPKEEENEKKFYKRDKGRCPELFVLWDVDYDATGLPLFALAGPLLLLFKFVLWFCGPNPKKFLLSLHLCCVLVSVSLHIWAHRCTGLPSTCDIISQTPP